MADINNRIIWIDYIKTVGIFLVILGHLFIKDMRVISFIYSFHMPLFFFISGILFKNEPLTILVKKNVKRLLIPYISFYIISYFWWLYFVFIRNASGLYPEPSVYECFIKPFIGMFIVVNYTTDISYYVNAALWFLIALFEVKILTALILKIKSKIIITILVVIISLFHIFIQQQQISLYFSIPTMILLFPFFILGYYSKKYIMNLSKFITGYKALILSLVWIVFQFILANNLYREVYPIKSINDYVIFFFIALSGIFCVYCISNISVKLYKIVRLVSDNTMTIMCIHIPINGLITGTLKNLFHVDTAGIAVITALGISLVSLFCSLLVAKVMQTYFPILIGEKR